VPAYGTILFSIRSEFVSNLLVAPMS
jgi:hypothetical protein